MLIIELTHLILSRPKSVINPNQKEKKKLILSCLLNQLIKNRVLPSPATLDGLQPR